jgi:hypothetical protein
MCGCQRTRLKPLPGKRLAPQKDWLQQNVRPSNAPAALPRRRMVGVTGVEPVTLRLSSACSNQLSYTPNAGGRRNRMPGARIPDPSLVELRRFELPTYSLQSCRSAN